MKKLYDISMDLAKSTQLSANAIYITIRTLVIFIPSLAAAFILKEYVHLPATTPGSFMVIFSGWITSIFGFWGGLLYLMRKD